MPSDLGSSYSNGTRKQDVYYTNNGRKVGDFCLGFFGIWIVIILITVISSWIISSFSGYSQIYNLFAAFSIYGLLFDILLIILGITISFRKGRRYIGIGILASALVPLLVFGACLIIIMGVGGF